jgi:transposase
MEETIAPIRVAWELREIGQSGEYIADRVGVHRSTVYRWLAVIRQRGIKRYIRHYRNAKKGAGSARPMPMSNSGC